MGSNGVLGFWGFGVLGLTHSAEKDIASAPCPRGYLKHVVNDEHACDERRDASTRDQTLYDGFCRGKGGDKAQKSQ